MKSYFAIVIMVSVASGCSGEGVTQYEQESSSTIQQPIYNGVGVTQTENPGAVALYEGSKNQPDYEHSGFICSGTLIRKFWVLTARHCLTVSRTPWGPLKSFNVEGGYRYYVVDGVTGGVPSNRYLVTQILDNPSSTVGSDIALIRVVPEVQAFPPVIARLWDGNGADLATFQQDQRYVNAMGFGRHTTPSSVGTLHSAFLTVSEVRYQDYDLRVSAGLQTPGPGDSGGPSFFRLDRVGRVGLQALVGVHSRGLVDNPPTASMAGAVWGTDVFVAGHRHWIKRKQFVPGDVNGDGRADITLVGGSGWGSIPVAFSNGDGTFHVENGGAGSIPGFANSPNVKILSGDFDGDGSSDVALTGPAGWTTVPVALSNRDGTFTEANLPGTAVANFASWATWGGARAVSGDVTGDGLDDITLTSSSGFGSLPSLIAAGSGSFDTTNNTELTNFPGWAALPNMKSVPGDFDGDGIGDIALVGAAGFTSIPIVFNGPGGAEIVTNKELVGPAVNFPSFSTNAGAKPVSGDFDCDGRDDIALVGGSGWTSIPVALSRADGTFELANAEFPNYASWAQWQNARPVAGDFDGNSCDDIALVGSPSFGSFPIAFSQGYGTFMLSNAPIGHYAFGSWAASPGVVALSGHNSQ
jgi:hypothetical protein